MNKLAELIDRIRITMQLMDERDWRCFWFVVRAFLIRWVVVPVVILGLIVGIVVVCIRVF